MAKPMIIAVLMQVSMQCLLGLDLVPVFRFRSMLGDVVGFPEKRLAHWQQTSGWAEQSKLRNSANG